MKETLKTIGVAVPCYKGHITNLKSLFDSIEQQTLKPTEVIVSCSSTQPEDIPYKQSDYTFPFKIITTPENRACAENRNIAASALNTDIITFIDADDIMHPQRLEFIQQAFNHNINPVIVMHAHTRNNFTSDIYSTIQLYPSALKKIPCGLTEVIFNKSMCLTNGHPSVLKSIFMDNKFHETAEFLSRDDAIFCSSIVERYFPRNIYIANELTLYLPSHTGGHL